MVHAAARALAMGKRVGFSRTSVLFAALACEGFINEFLDEHLSSADFTALDRLPTIEKYVLGPRVAINLPLFDRGNEPIQSLRELFRLRDQLVHAKPQEVPPRGGIFDNPADFPVFNPTAAARYIAAVADAAASLAQHSGEPMRNLTVFAIAQGRALIERYGRAASDSMPPLGAAAQEDLVMQAIQFVTGRSRDETTGE